MKIIGLVTGGHEFHIKIMNENNAEIHNMGKGINRFITEFFKLPDGDIYITESNFYAPIIIKKIIQRKNVKIVNIGGSRFIFKNTNFILKWLINKIDLMLVEGEFGEENIQKVGYKGIIQIIYPTCDSKKYENSSKKIRENKKIKICTIARFDWKMKGLDILEEGIKDIDCEVNIIGKSEYKPKTNKIKMLGDLSEEEKIKTLEKCNLYVQPSRFDTFGIAVLEAAYAGLPILVSDFCGVKEFVDKKCIFKNSEDLNKILKRNKFENTFNFDKFKKVNKNLKINFEKK